MYLGQEGIRYHSVRDETHMGVGVIESLKILSLKSLYRASLTVVMVGQKVASKAINRYI